MGPPATVHQSSAVKGIPNAPGIPAGVTLEPSKPSRGQDYSAQPALREGMDSSLAFQPENDGASHTFRLVRLSLMLTSVLGALLALQMSFSCFGKGFELLAGQVP